jgi:hypothetical protein
MISHPSSVCVFSVYHCFSPSFGDLGPSHARAFILFRTASASSTNLAVQLYFSGVLFSRSPRASMSLLSFYANVMRCKRYRCLEITSFGGKSVGRKGFVRASGLPPWGVLCGTKKKKKKQKKKKQNEHEILNLKEICIELPKRNR